VLGHFTLSQLVDSGGGRGNVLHPVKKRGLSGRRKCPGEICPGIRSLQKVQGHRIAQGHRAGVDVDVTPPTGGPVGHPPNPATLCDRSEQGSKS